MSHPLYATGRKHAKSTTVICSCLLVSWVLPSRTCVPRPGFGTSASVCSALNWKNTYFNQIFQLSWSHRHCVLTHASTILHTDSGTDRSYKHTQTLNAWLSSNQFHFECVIVEVVMARQWEQGALNKRNAWQTAALLRFTVLIWMKPGSFILV